MFCFNKIGQNNFIKQIKREKKVIESFMKHNDDTNSVASVM